MKKYAPRCTVCATPLADTSRGFKKVLRAIFGRTLYCPHCKMDVPKASAVVMGETYGLHLTHLKLQVRDAAMQLARLDLNDALRAIEPGLSREQINPAHSMENLLQFAREVYRPLLLEQAKARHASLEAGLRRDATGRATAAGVWGHSSAETGEREWDLLFARVGKDQYIVYQAPRPVAWLHEAVRLKRGKGNGQGAHHGSGVQVLPRQKAG